MGEERGADEGAAQSREIVVILKDKEAKFILDTLVGLEWITNYNGYSVDRLCPVCDAETDGGPHKTDCALLKSIRILEQTGEGT